MTMLVLDPLVADQFIHDRRESGNDRWDEVWDGVYLLMPSPNVEHQDLAGGLVTVFRVNIDWKGRGKSFAGVNVSDRVDEWTNNYRCPDVAVYLVGNPSVDRGAYWFGGPDFAVEMVSPDDRALDKLGFYASVGVRELLIIDRGPWSLELFRRQGEELVSVGVAGLEQSDGLVSAVLPFRFRLVPTAARPGIEVVHVDDGGSWIV